MSRESLEHLRDYIQLTLTPSDLSWLMDELIVGARKKELLKPYTMEELHERIAQGERDLAEGRYRDIEDLFKEWDEEAMTYAAEAEPEYNGRKVSNLGPVEPLLTDEPICYRSVVVPPYNKIIYTITDDTIDIVDFWDTRRDPSTLVNEVS